METLQLTKTGEIRGKGTSGEPLSLLSGLVTLDEGFTLSSFFSMLETYPVFIRLSPVITALKQIADNAASCPKTQEIEELIFYKTVTMKGFPGPPALDIYNTLKGINGEGNRVGLKFFQLESLLDHGIRLGALEHVIFGDSQKLLTCETHYTLFEFIDGVTWELSFNFNPLQCSIRG